ncbi:MAG TPA: nuclear transport factor 2 family protein [Candidatus Aquilonibacter sp.]|nr:nuclear transport factor 2 family protein [Candidatus Aquilonibacter sp.]
MPNESDERDILKLFEDGDRALIAAEVTELERIYADDYLQCDPAGKTCDRKELIRRLISGEIRFVSMKSTGRRIRMLRDDIAVVHGSEEDEIEQDGTKFHVGYLYMDVVIKRDRRWQIVASQLVKLSET